MNRILQKLKAANLIQATPALLLILTFTHAGCSVDVEKLQAQQGLQNKSYDLCSDSSGNDQECQRQPDQESTVETSPGSADVTAPVMVSGAFLTVDCKPDLDNHRAACRLLQEDGQPAEILNFKWVLVQKDGSKVVLEVAIDPNSEYPYILTLPVDFAADEDLSIHRPTSTGEVGEPIPLAASHETASESGGAQGKAKGSIKMKDTLTPSEAAVDTEPVVSEADPTVKQDVGNGVVNGNGVGNGVVNGNGVGNGVVNGNGVGNGVANGNGVGNGVVNGNGVGNGGSQAATTPQPPTIKKIPPGQAKKSR